MQVTHANGYIRLVVINVSPNKTKLHPSAMRTVGTSKRQWQQRQYAERWVVAQSNKLGPSVSNLFIVSLIHIKTLLVYDIEKFNK